MTDEEYREFLAILVRRHVRPRLPRLRRHFHHHMMEEWHYHLDQAERSVRVFRFIEQNCDEGDEIYDTITPARDAGSVRDQVQPRLQQPNDRGVGVSGRF